MPLPGDQHQETAITANPFAPPQARINEFTAKEIATLQSRLHKQLGPEYISTRQGPGGGRVHYLAADKAINLANEVFGFNGWSTAIQNVQIDFVDEERGGEISLGLSVIVRVTLRDGTFHEDIGYGSIKNCKGKAAAFEKAKKEGVTDALKRALRNFGNVLGNCLYDKEYLQKVAKIKVAPTKFDAERLHRHKDFRPVQKEGSTNPDEKQENGNAVALRQSSARSNARTDSIEFDDDFGAGFDESDFPHSDEMLLEKTPMRNVDKGSSGGMQQEANIQKSQMASGPPPPRPPPPQAIQAAQRQQPPSKPPMAAGQAPTDRMRPPPAVNNQQGVGAAQANQNQALATTTAVPANPQPQQAMQNAAPHPGQFDENGMRLRPPGHPEGFVTGRSAELLVEASGPRTPGVVIKRFNPVADSPSIRRTSGVDQTKSVAIKRQQIGTTAPPNNAVPTPALPENGMNGNTTPMRSNFVNPCADPNRRIGMPPNAMHSRGSYKPPIPAKRPPLGDVSNLQQQTDGASDPKKPRVEQDANAAVPPTT